jgi:outer membrane murein-binding lipoprotein Lpp
MKRLTIAPVVLSLGLFVGCASKQKTEPSTTPAKAAAAQEELNKETTPVAPAATTTAPAAATEVAPAAVAEAAPAAAPEPPPPPPPPAPVKKVKKK